MTSLGLSKEIETILNSILNVDDDQGEFFIPKVGQLVAIRYQETHKLGFVDEIIPGVDEGWAETYDILVSDPDKDGQGEYIQVYPTEISFVFDPAQFKHKKKIVTDFQQKKMKNDMNYITQRVILSKMSKEIIWC